MPTRPPRRCTRCTKLATNKGRCDDHQPTPWATKSANSQALTGRQRAQLKAKRLAYDPTCAVCDEDDTSLLELDHIIEIADGGDPHDFDNTWLLCTPCHAVKTSNARKARKSRPRRY